MPLTYNLKRTTEPAIEPVTVSELKDHLRISDSVDDARLETLIAVAREVVEIDARRSLISQTWTLECDNWPPLYLELPMPPLASVTSIKYVDTGGTQQTWSSAEYEVDTSSEPGIVRLAYGQSFPDIRGDERGIEVIYVAGYGTTASSVPDMLKHAIKLQAEMQYDCPTPELEAAYNRIVRMKFSGVYP